MVACTTTTTTTTTTTDGLMGWILQEDGAVKGIVLCGTGMGVGMIANKVKGIRSVVIVIVVIVVAVVGQLMVVVLVLLLQGCGM